MKTFLYTRVFFVSICWNFQIFTPRNREDDDTEEVERVRVEREDDLRRNGVEQELIRSECDNKTTVRQRSIDDN